MSIFLVTTNFKNTSLMAAAYDLFIKVIEDGTLNDEFDEFVFRKSIMLLTQIMYA